MIKDTETRILNVLAQATADITGRHAVYRKVLRVATTLKPEHFEDAQLAFDAQEGHTRSQIGDRAQARAQEDRDKAINLLKQIEAERLRANQEAAEAEKKKKAPVIRGHVWG
jgi:hypothetical protein